MRFQVYIEKHEIIDFMCDDVKVTFTSTCLYRFN